VIEGPYLNVERVFPRDGARDVQAIGVNPALVALFADADPDARRPSVRLTFTGATRAIVVTTSDPNFAGLVMPMRLEASADATSVPAWVYAEPSAARGAYGF